jgi:hypothetical protein
VIATGPPTVIGIASAHVPLAVRPTGDPSVATQETPAPTYTETLPSGAAAPLTAVTVNVTDTGCP